MMQTANLLIAVLLSLGLFLAGLQARLSRNSIIRGIYVGISCMFIGLAGDILFGGSFVDTLALGSASGFGRTYLLGSSFTVASFLMLMFRIIKPPRI